MPITKLGDSAAYRDNRETEQMAKVNEVIDSVNGLQALTDAIAAPAETAVTIEAVHAALVALGLIAAPE